LLSLPPKTDYSLVLGVKFVAVQGLDHIIPPSILRKAKGFAFITIVKAGFVFSARAGTGVVIARLRDGTWSAPSAIGTAGVGAGFQMGAGKQSLLLTVK